MLWHKTSKAARTADSMDGRLNWFWGRDRLGLPWHLYLAENTGEHCLVAGTCGHRSPRIRDRQGEVPLPRDSICQSCVAEAPEVIVTIAAL
jgi:hypothetical protein